jgi:putative SOS response-associated peptidase YedK
MCGRFVQTSSADRLATHFDAADATGGALRPRFNVAPSTLVPAVLRTEGRRLGMLRWGFVPAWSSGPESGPRPINARAEGAAASRLFSPALARRRCIVPIDGWYEWTDEAGQRQPWLIRTAADGPAAVAGLWSVWRAQGADPATPPLGTVTLLTTEAIGPAADIHHRMPVLVPWGLLDDWLDPAASDGASLLEALQGVGTELEVRRVSRRVNDVRNDDPSLIEAVDG